MFPHLQAYSPHKISPRSILCIFSGQSTKHKGYKCLNPVTPHINITKHVRFDEMAFPFSCDTSSPNMDDFLLRIYDDGPTLMPTLPTMTSPPVLVKSSHCVVVYGIRRLTLIALWWYCHQNWLGWVLYLKWVNHFKLTSISSCFTNSTFGHFWHFVSYHGYSFSCRYHQA